jgi:hypothetical protein
MSPKYDDFWGAMAWAGALGTSTLVIWMVIFWIKVFVL